MKQSFDRLVTRTIDKVANFSLDKLMADFEADARSGNFKRIGNRMLKLLNVRPVYSNEGQAGYEDMRKKLQTESGVIIANHPGYIDPFVLCAALNERPDILVMAHSNIYASIEKRLGKAATEPHFLSSSPTKENLQNIIPRVAEHIKKGGVFLIFPTGMMHDEFQSTFRRVLENMDADKMVYSFHIDTKDADELQKDYARYTGLASTLLPDADLLMNINDLRSPKTVRVDENYTQAREWQEVLKKGPTKGQNLDQALTSHFNAQFETAQS